MPSGDKGHQWGTVGRKGNVLSVHRNGRMYLRGTGGRVVERVYYSINEESAKTAHQMMSFSDYKEGSKTAEYKGYVPFSVSFKRTALFAAFMRSCTSFRLSSFSSSFSIASSSLDLISSFLCPAEQ